MSSVVINATNFPDEYFRAYVRNFDTDNDGELSDSELAAVTEIECVQYYNSQYDNLWPSWDATGIEYFTNLKKIRFAAPMLAPFSLTSFTDLEELDLCQCYRLNALNVRYNTKLKYLDIRRTSISSVNLELNTDLEVFKAGWDSYKPSVITSDVVAAKSYLQSLDFTNNTKLKEFYYSNEYCDTKLSTITGLSYCESLESFDLYHSQVASLDFTGCTNLEDITLISNPNLISVDAHGLTNLSSFQILDPDSQSVPQREIYLSGCTSLLQINPGSALNAKVLNVSNCTNLSGSLYMAGVGLQTLNVVNCSKLSSLDVTSNKLLPPLNLTGCTSLKTIRCGQCNFNTSLDVSFISTLEELECSESNLVGLTLGNHPNLKSLQCIGYSNTVHDGVLYNNHISALDISQCPKILQLIAVDNPSHLYIEGILDAYDYDGDDVSTLYQEFSGYRFKYDAVTSITTGAPVITQQPQNQVVAAIGDSATFTVTATGNDLAYQWQYYNTANFRWENCIESGADTASILVTAETNFRRYRCRVSSGYAVTDSDEANLTLAETPTFVQQPASQTVQEGSSATFSVTATFPSYASVLYQWQISSDNGETWANISGATERTYEFVTTLEMNGTKYRCTASSSTGSGSGYSSVATLTVIGSVLPPTITAQPQSQTVAESQNATFSVTATGDDLSYQWQISTDDGATWADVSGATSASYTIASVTPAMTRNQYRCNVSNNAGTTTSNAATLIVRASSLPVITQQPQNQTVAEGQSATFSVTATGNNLSYQWQSSSDDGTTWSNIGVASGANYYTIQSAATAMSGSKYRCIVIADQGSSGSVTSDAAILTVTSDTGITPPTVTSQPQNQTVQAGNNATFSVTATGENLSYQWQTYRNGTWYNITGATSSSYTATGTTEMSGTQYHCVVSNSAGAVTSDAATLTVTSASQVTTPAITSQPQSQTVQEGQTAGFRVAASGGALSYQWQRENNGTWYDISGATSNVYNFTAGLSDNGKQYRCIVTNAAGSVTSNVVILTVTEAPYSPTPYVPPTPIYIEEMQMLINGVDISALIAHRGVKWSRNDIDGPEAGRNLLGELIRDRVTTKIRLDITCVPMTADKHSMLMQLLMPEFVSVQYDDPVYGKVTKIMYSNNHSSEFLMPKLEGKYWYNISFPLIEK